MRFPATAALLLVLSAAPALAQDGTTQYQTIGDYRWAVYTACSLVFLALIVYLVITHRSGAKLGEDITHLERRIDELER